MEEKAKEVRKLKEENKELALEVAAAEKRVQELEKEQEKEVREEEKKNKATAIKEREEKRQKEKEEAEKKIKEKAEKARVLREVTAGRKGEARGERREASSRGGGKRKLQAANKIIRQEAPRRPRRPQGGNQRTLAKA